MDRRRCGNGGKGFDGMEKPEEWGMCPRQTHARHGFRPGSKVYYLPWHFLYFFPLPQGHLAFLLIFGVALLAGGLLGWFLFTKSINSVEGTLNEKTVLPLWLVTAKSPIFIMSMPIRTSAPVPISPSVTFIREKATLFGSIILIR